MQKSFFLATAACLLLLAAPLAAAQDKESGRRGKKVSLSYAKQEDLIELQNDVTALAKGQAEIKEQIAQLAALLRESRGGSATESHARLMAKLDEVLQEILVLSEKLSDANYRLAMGARIAPSSAPPATAAGGIAEPSTPTTRSGAALEGDPAYQAAYADYTRGNYALAIMGFEEFMRQNPKHDLADNALYWIGECHYAERRFDKAIEAFERLQQDFPQSEKFAAALLKQGYAYIESYQMAQGIVRLQGLVEKYPQSSEARLARQKLKEMGL